MYALAMAEHLGRRDWARKALTAFDEYCQLDPVQVPNHGRTVCLHCGKHYEEVVEQTAVPATSPNGLTYGCQACWDDINGDAHVAGCHRSTAK